MTAHRIPKRHLVAAVHFADGYVECSCEWTDARPGRSYDATRDAFASHRRDTGQPLTTNANRAVAGEPTSWR
jgi:hypothetical protein